MFVELKPVERAQTIDETIERAACNIFDAPAGATDRMMVMAVITGHKGRLAAVVQPQGCFAFRSEPFERPINGCPRNGCARFVEARAKLGCREETGLGPQDAGDRLPRPGLVFGFHAGRFLRPSLKSLPRRARTRLLMASRRPRLFWVRPNALTGPPAPA